MLQSFASVVLKEQPWEQVATARPTTIQPDLPGAVTLLTERLSLPLSAQPEHSAAGGTFRLKPQHRPQDLRCDSRRLVYQNLPSHDDHKPGNENWSPGA